MEVVGVVGMDGVVGVVTPVNGELDVNRLGTSRMEVDEVGVGEVGVGVVVFQLSSGFHMTGFYWDLGWLHQRQVKPQDERFWRFWRWWTVWDRTKQVDSLGISGWLVVTVVITLVLVAG